MLHGHNLFVSLFSDTSNYFYFQSDGKCQIQPDNLSHWPEHMLSAIKYQISDSSARNLKIFVQPFLKLPLNGLFLVLTLF